METLEGMDSKKLGRKTPSPSPARPRIPLTDISNSPVLSTCTKTHDTTLSSQLWKGNAVQQQQEVAALKRTLKEKQEIIETQKRNLEANREIIEAQKRNMERLWLNYCRKSRQNDDIIQHNGQLYKDLMQARDKLRLVQHEDSLMAAMHKIINSELQLKLTEAEDHAKHLQALLDTSANEKDSSDKQLNAQSVLVTKFLDSCEASGESKLDCSGDSTLDCAAKRIENFEENPVLCRPRSRRSKSYKEPSVRVKIRQEDSAGDRSCQIRTHKIQDGDSTEGLQKVCEDEDLGLAVSSISSNSQAEIGQESSHLRSDPIQPSEENSTTSTSRLRSDPIQPPEETSTALTSATSVQASQGRRHTSMADSVDLSYRNSTDRPLRRSVSSIGSYKEPPLNTKMRRPQ